MMVFVVKCMLLACFVWEWHRYHRRGGHREDAVILVALGLSLAMLDHRELDECNAVVDEYERRDAEVVAGCIAEGNAPEDCDCLFGGFPTKEGCD